MNNTVLPYTEHTDSSDESDSSQSSEEGNLLTNNIGILYNGSDIKNQKFMNMENVEDYQNKRNKLFTPQLSKFRLLVESKNIEHTENYNTSNYTIFFKGNNQLNKTSGFTTYNNVIGFKLIQAIIPNATYQIHKNNKKIKFTINSGNPINIELIEGKYTFEELGDHLQTRLSNGFTVVNDVIINKYTIQNNSQFQILWKDSEGYAYNLFGFENKNINSNQLLSNNFIISTIIPQQSNHFVDLVIPEIPHIACKKNSIGKNVIERIPLGESGKITTYKNDYNLDNYFYPINLHKLNIQLYEDKSELFYECQNSNNSFEFEITIMNY